MKTKDSLMLEEAYNSILEAKKKKLSDKEKKIASAAPPYDKITKADIITLAKKKDLKEASAGIEDQEEEHCESAYNGCECDGCGECIENQKTVKEDVRAVNPLTLNNGDLVSWKGTQYKVEDVMGGAFKLIPVI